MRRLFVTRMPLSWCEEGEKLPSGYRVKSQSVGRRVWGHQVGLKVYMIETDGPSLVLRNMLDDGYVVQSWPTSAGYDSPWGGEGHSRLVQTAEWHEAHAFNAWLSGMQASQNAAWEEACKQMAKDCARDDQ